MLLLENIKLKKEDKKRPLHEDFKYFLKLKEQGLIDLFLDMRSLILTAYPDCNEILYNTHALTSVYSISERLSDGFCHIPIYSSHLNLGFNKGTLLSDPNNLLMGSGKLIRHIPIKTKAGLKNKAVKQLIKNAIDYAIKDMDKEPKLIGQTISKIKQRG